METTFKAEVLKAVLCIFLNGSKKQSTYVWHPFLELPVWPEREERKQMKKGKLKKINWRIYHVINYAECYRFQGFLFVCFFRQLSLIFELRNTAGIAFFSWSLCFTRYIHWEEFWWQEFSGVHLQSITKTVVLCTCPLCLHSGSGKGGPCTHSTHWDREFLKEAVMPTSRFQPPKTTFFFKKNKQGVLSDASAGKKINWNIVIELTCLILSGCSSVIFHQVSHVDYY